MFRYSGVVRGLSFVARLMRRVCLLSIWDIPRSNPTMYAKMPTNGLRIDTDTANPNSNPSLILTLALTLTLTPISNLVLLLLPCYGCLPITSRIPPDAFYSEQFLAPSFSPKGHHYLLEQPSPLTLVLALILTLTPTLAYL